MLLLFPIWVALSRLGDRWPWLRYAYLSVSAPIAVVLGMLYLSGQWAGCSRRQPPQAAAQGEAVRGAREDAADRIVGT